MTFRGQRLAFLAVLLVTVPLFGQQQDERIRQLELRLDELARQVGEVRQEIDRLKGATAPSPPAAAPDDLTKIDIAPPTPAAPALTDVQPVANVPNPGSSKIFNPDTSVIGEFFGRAGRTNPWEFGSADLRPSMQLGEAEVGLEAFVDPYAKAKFFLAASPEGLSVEEGYVQFVALPYDLTAKAGKVKAAFGKANTWHTHVRPWVDQPLVIHNLFGDEQLADSGVSVSKVFPSSFAFVEATGEVFRGDVPNVFGTHNANDVFTNSHLKVFKDLSDNSNIEAGGSWARGTAAGSSAKNQFAGIDLTWRWRPLERGLYNSLIARFEGIVNDRAGIDRNLRGFYASLDYQLGQRWFAGARIDRADRFRSAEGALLLSPAADRGVSATLTFWPSEFSQLRGQLRRTSYGDVRRSATEFLFQLQFAIGAHGAHTF